MTRAFFPLVLVCGLSSSGCFLAPGPIGGNGTGETCSSDLNCDDGLICACGTCAALDVPRSPPSCDVVPDNRCNETPSPCYESCGVEVVVGLAECLNGRESCAASAGTLYDDCSVNTCWGMPAPGEICVDGEFDCAFGRSALLGTCYTFDCEGDPEECVATCASDTRTTQACLGSEWRCEVGFPVRQCGGCVGTPPRCVDGCASIADVGPATCVDEEWDCAGAPVLLGDCCALSMTLLSSADVTPDVLATTCVLGDLIVGGATLQGELELPVLVRAGHVVVVDSLLGTLSLPSLREVHGAFEIVDNALLDELLATELAFVDGAFTVADNPELDVCAVESLVAQVESRDGITGTINVPSTDDAGCPVVDGGEVDGGDGDAGVVDGDAGVVDGGDLDAGVVDGGADGGALDAGVVDGGVHDAGVSVDGGALDAGVTDAG